MLEGGDEVREMAGRPGDARVVSPPGLHLGQVLPFTPTAQHSLTIRTAAEAFEAE